MEAGVGSDRIFVHRSRSSNKKNMCMGFMINEADSLGDDKTVDYVNGGIASLVEGCSKLEIPCYVMGYSFENGIKNHNHYVTWDNSEEKQTSLVNLKKSEGCFDGYSIRYFVDNIVSSRTEEHKIVMVISGGLPTQTFEGIDFEEDLKQTCSLFHRKNNIDFTGVVIGNSDEGFRRIFGGKKCSLIPETFNSTAYPNIMAKAVCETVRGWE